MPTVSTASDRVTVREYLRVSLDRSGRERSNDEQHQDHERMAEQHGWTLGEPYRDVGSASKYGNGKRDGYAKLVGDLEAGRFGADVLLIWESSRGSRKVSEWARMVELCEARGVMIAVCTHGRVYDPANARDARTLHEDSSDAQYETGKMSERIRRSAAANAETGRYHGRIPYGYRRTRDPDTGRTTAQVADPAEAPIVRELVQRLRKGETLNAVAVDFERIGHRTRTGRPWRPEHLRDLALRPVYAGIRVHRGKEYPGTWPPLVTPADFYAVRSLLTAPERRTVRPGKGKHLLSQIARCDVCGGKLVAMLRDPDNPRYHCHDGGHVTVSKPELDDLAERVICEYLARDDVYEALTATGTDEQAIQSVRDELGALRSRLGEIADQVADGAMTAALAARAEQRITTRVAELQARERELITPPALAGFITPGKDVGRRWKAAPIAARREVARILLSPGLLGELRVGRVGRGRAGVPAHERVTWGRS